MAKIEIASNIVANGISTPVLVTSVARSKYGELLIGLFGTFDGATAEVKISRDSAGTDAMSLGTLASVTTPTGISVNAPDGDDVYIFVQVVSAGISTDISAELYV